MSIEIRPTSPDELRAAAAVTAAALLSAPPNDEEWAKREPSWKESDSVSAWDGDTCVGHAAAFPFDSTVPGGARLSMSGVTRVGVLPTYTRRGLLSRMMEQLLRDARDRGIVLAGLRASEAVIYRRFGFGVAGEAAAVTVMSKRARPVHAPAPGSMRLLARDEILDVVPDLYDRCARGRTGTVSRPRWMFERYFDDAITGAKPVHVAVHLDPRGEPDGFVHYSVAWDESENDATGKGDVYDIFGVDAAVDRALWSYIVGIDLIDEWKAQERPPDDGMRYAFADLRAYRIREYWDEQWLRLLDVDAALGARTYRPGEGSVVIRVRDPWFADNDGSWRVDASGATSTGAAPDLEVTIDALSAAYLGGTAWRSLADAGHVTVHRERAITEADTLFAEHPAPFCGTFY
jgi:predicted acetyltransferase